VRVVLAVAARARRIEFDVEVSAPMTPLASDRLVRGPQRKVCIAVVIKRGVLPTALVVTTLTTVAEIAFVWVILAMTCVTVGA